MNKLFAACDPKYFIEHAPAFVYSANKNGYNTHIDICYQGSISTKDSDVIRTKTIIEILQEKCNHFSYSVSHVESGIPEEQLKSYFSVHRFYAARDYIKRNSHDSICIMDIDCYVNKPFPVFDLKESIGLFIREPLPGTTGWENHGTHVAAGMVLLQPPLHSYFIERVISKIEQYKLRWFVDQVALWETYQDMELDSNNSDEFFCFTPDHMDWEFKPDTFIWTGKGDRKYLNETYVSVKNTLTNECISNL